jgi:hypothetical protein
MARETMTPVCIGQSFSRDVAETAGSRQQCRAADPLVFASFSACALLGQHSITSAGLAFTPDKFACGVDIVGAV